MPHVRDVVLASRSPRRFELLRSLGLSVDVRPSSYDEAAHPELTPKRLAELHARGKLDAVLAIHGTDERAIVAADTVVDDDGLALGKPRDASDAERMLARLSGREHVVHTAWTMRLPGGGDAHVVEGLRSTRVRFHRLSSDQIAGYAAGGEPLDKAGAYGIAGRGAALVQSIDGDFYSVMGFPLGDFIRALAALGFSLPVENSADSMHR